MSSVMTKHFPTISSGLNFQWAMSLSVMDKVAAIVWSEFTDCWSKDRDRFNWIWGPMKMYKYTKFSITRNLTYLNWVTRAKTSSMSFLFKSPITKSIRIWINLEAANAIRTQLERFQVSLDGHKKWMSYSSKILGLYCNAFRTHSNLPKHMRHPFCLLQWPVPWQILQSPDDAHVALAPDPHASYLPESKLGLNIWRIVVRISPTSPKVDAPQQLVRKNDHKEMMAVDDKNVLGVCTWCWCDIGGGVWAPLSPLAKRCWIGWSWPLDLTSWP